MEDEVRKFINSLHQIDKVGQTEPKDADLELVEMLVKDWFKSFYPDKETDEDITSVVAQVFKQANKLIANHHLVPYVEAMFSWYQLSKKNNEPEFLPYRQMFLFGYCWAKMENAS